MPSTLSRQVLEIARSNEDRPIELLLLNHQENQPLDTLFIGVFHGDEGISGALLTCFVDYLQQPDSWTKAKLPTDTAVGIVIVLNPDGMAVEKRVNANGVDLNRNFPTANWEENEKGSDYYSGTKPASEPETRAVVQLIEEYRPKKIITVHSPYKVINFDGPSEALANAMSNAMPIDNRYPVVADIGYPTPGSFGTYAGIERNIPVITLELPEDEPLNRVWADNREALLEAVRFQMSG